MREPTFTGRELDIMSILWRHESGSVTEVREALGDTVAYTTVLKILQILEEKGAVRHEAEGRAYRYFPLVESGEAGGTALGKILEKIFGLIPHFKSKDELLEEEFAKFVVDYKPGEAEAIPAIKTYFKAYLISDQIRHIIESKQFTDLATNPVFSTRDFRAVPQKFRVLIPDYVKDYVSLNQFVT